MNKRLLLFLIVAFAVLTSRPVYAQLESDYDDYIYTTSGSSFSSRRGFTIGGSASMPMISAPSASSSHLRSLSFSSGGSFSNFNISAPGAAAPAPTLKNFGSLAGDAPRRLGGIGGPGGTGGGTGVLDEPDPEEPVPAGNPLLPLTIMALLAALCFSCRKNHQQDEERI